MKIAYTISSLLVLTVAGLVFLGGTSFGDIPPDCPCSMQGNLCSWLPDPTQTNAVSGHFDTATDGISPELKVQWCFQGNPIGGTFTFDAAHTTNVVTSPQPVFTPTQFSATCSGEQSVTVSGDLVNRFQAGLLQCKVLIGPFPGCGQNVTHNLSINP